jgi:hypothetical protein
MPIPVSFHTKSGGVDWPNSERSNSEGPKRIGLYADWQRWDQQPRGIHSSKIVKTNIGPNYCFYLN